MGYTALSVRYGVFSSRERRRCANALEVAQVRAGRVPGRSKTLFDFAMSKMALQRTKLPSPGFLVG
jgi:hypothetical protein